MQRWKLTIEYDGTDFVGWQRQPIDVSVQACLEKAVYDFSGETVTSHAAGRTDSGVHAVGQVAHIDLEKPCDAQTVCDAINFHLRPHAIAVLKAAPVPSDFHARFSAIRRIYCYTILMSRHVQPSIGSRYMWHVWRNLDLDAMREAAAHLLGAHDFTSFRAAHCQAKSPLRTLDRLEFIEKEDPFSFGRRIEVWVEARSFLHRQVRNMTGTLKLVGEGRWKPDDVRRALEAKDRCAAGPAAPASGLCFMRADYPDLEPGTASTHPPAR